MARIPPSKTSTPVPSGPRPAKPRVGLAHEEDVHRPGGEAAAHDPDPVGDLLGPRPVQPAPEPRAGVEEPRQAALGGGLGLGHEPDRPRQRQGVDDGVVADDRPVADLQHVEALDRHPRAGGLDALERLAREGPARDPADGHAVVLHRALEHLERQVGERVDQRVQAARAPPRGPGRRPSRRRGRRRRAPTGRPPPRRRGRRSPRSRRRPRPGRRSRGRGRPSRPWWAALYA